MHFYFLFSHNLYDYIDIPKVFFNFSSFYAQHTAHNSLALQYDGGELHYPVLNSFIKKLYKFRYLSVGSAIFFKKSMPRDINPILFKKLVCFWPIVKKGNNLNGFLVKLFKKSNKKYIYFLHCIYKNISKLKKLRTYKYKFISIFAGKNEPKTKKSYFFNFHRRRIKIFWKSQEFFKTNFLRKTRFTTRKFKNKFNFWYKKNKQVKHLVAYKLSSLLAHNFLFFSANHLNTFFDSKLIYKNNNVCFDKHEIVRKFDILTLPQNYASLLITILLGKFFSLSMLKKKILFIIKIKLVSERI